MPKDMRTNLLSGWTQKSNNGRGLGPARHFAQPVDCTMTGCPVATRDAAGEQHRAEAQRHQLCRLVGHRTVSRAASRTIAQHDGSVQQHHPGNLIRQQIDAQIRPPGGWPGSNMGTVVSLWLCHLVMERDHRLVVVRDGAAARTQTLNALLEWADAHRTVELEPQA
jgi:hypothetical protein